MPTSETKPDRGIYHYLVVLTGIVCCFGPCALALSCAGIFFPAVTASLDVSNAKFAAYLTIMLVVASLALPFLGKIMEKYDARIVLSVAVLCIGLPLIAMSFSNAVWQFYIAGAIMGLGMAVLLVLTVPTLINRWYRKRVGFYIGLCMAFTGIGGVAFNPVGGHFINSGSEGWRTGYLVFGIIAIALALPFTLFAVHSRPSDVGMLPFGANDAPEGKADLASVKDTGITSAAALKLPVFYLFLVFVAISNICINLYQYLPTYAKSLTQYPDVVEIAAALASAAMLGQAIGKVLLGIINDRTNITAVVLTATSCGIAGVAVIVFIPQYAWLVLVAGFLFGVFYANGTVLTPLMTRAMFGNLDYSGIYSKVAMVGTFAGAFALTLWGLVVDLWGARTMLLVGLGLIALLLVLGLTILKASKKIEFQTAESQ